MKRAFIGVYNLANSITYLGILAALLGIYHAGNARAAMLCMVVAGICDLFDGRVARMFKRTETEKAFGIQLDSFADTVSFVIFPAVFLLAQSHSVWAWIIAALYVLCGITRLCWFDITTDGNTTYYSGVPVTYISLILPVLYAVATFAALPMTVLVPVVMLIMAALFILNIQVKKPGGIWYAIFAVIAIATAVILLVR